MKFWGDRVAVLNAFDELVFTGAAGFNGNAVVNVSVSDVGNSGSGGALVDTGLSYTYVVSAVNDAPTIFIETSPLGAVEDVVYSLPGTQVSVSDSDVLEGSGVVRVVLSVSSGTISAVSPPVGVTVTSSGTASVSLEGPIADVNEALSRVNYLGTANFVGSDEMTVFVSDLGNTGSGGVLNATSSFVITVSGVNDAPVLTVLRNATATEDVAMTLGGGLFGFTDVDANGLNVSLTLTSAGRLFVSSDGGGSVIGNLTTSLVVTGTLSELSASLSTLGFVSVSDMNGLETVSVLLDDLGHTGAGGSLNSSGTLFVTVSAVNDAPVGSLFAPTVAAVENAAQALPSAGFLSVVDVDLTEGADALLVWANVTNGEFIFSGRLVWIAREREFIGEVLGRPRRRSECV